MSRVRVVETNLPFRCPLSERHYTRELIAHHVGHIPVSLDPADIGAEMINDWHIARGWAGIGYHYVIRLDGTIERGRPRWAQGAHDGGQNAGSIGICVVGDFTDPNSRPTPAQLESLTNLMADLCEIYRLCPAGPGVIQGHRDQEPPETPTECPGEGLYRLLPAIRENVRALCAIRPC